MNKIHLLIILIFSCSLFSCKPTIEEKAAKLIKNDLTLELENNKSYTPISTTIDSAYTPWDNPILLNNMDSVINTYIKVNSYTNLVIQNYQSLFDQNEDNLIPSVIFAIKYSKKIDSLIDNVTINDSIWNNSPSFIGYKIKHKYQVQTSVGNIEEKYACYLTDSNLNIIRKYDSIDNQAEEMILTLKNKIPNDIEKQDIPYLIQRLCKSFILDIKGTREILRLIKSDNTYN